MKSWSILRQLWFLFCPVFALLIFLCLALFQNDILVSWFNSINYYLDHGMQHKIIWFTFISLKFRVLYTSSAFQSHFLREDFVLKNFFFFLISFFDLIIFTQAEKRKKTKWWTKNPSSLQEIKYHLNAIKFSLSLHPFSLNVNFIPWSKSF